MTLHQSTFEYLKPTDEQIEKMTVVRCEFLAFTSTLMTFLPDGPDKTYIARKLREAAMWANVAITRNPDGSPRSD